MRLREFFSKLSYGPLSNLSIGGEGSGIIPAQHEQRLMHLTEQSLIALFGRFNLLEKDVVIRILPGRTEYPLRVEHALTSTTLGVDKFIHDSAGRPFTGDVLKILEVYDEAGCPRVLNDSGDCSSLFTPSHDVLQVPLAPAGVPHADGYAVLYQARHPELDPTTLDQKLLLPETLIPALEAHVSYQVISPMNGAEHVQKAAELLSRFEMICAEVENRDLASTSIIQTHDKFCQRGFV